MSNQASFGGADNVTLPVACMWEMGLPAAVLENMEYLQDGQ
jgi:hypothetical protein